MKKSAGNVYIKVLRTMKKALRSLFRNGFRYTFRKIIFNLTSSVAALGRKKENRFAVSGTERSRQVKCSLPVDTKFSIIVSALKTSEQYLYQMIDSLKKQTYSNWELYISADNNKQLNYIREICSKVSEKDSRIICEHNGSKETSIVETASGEYLCFLRVGDILHPSALYEAAKAIVNKNADFIYTDENLFKDAPDDMDEPIFKPDFAPDMLRSYNYIGSFIIFSRKLLIKAGRLCKLSDGSRDYDTVLRLTEAAEHIIHIPRILYFKRSDTDRTDRPYETEQEKKALTEHLERIGLKGSVMESTIRSTYRVKYDIKGNPLVSILIPNKNHLCDISGCIESIFERTSYPNYEIIIIENSSDEKGVLDYYKELCVKHNNIKIVTWENGFNFSAINNYGFKQAQGEYILLLNNDTKVITSDWIQEMLMFAQRNDVGAVGTMLYYPDDTIQHAGVILGLGGIAGHCFKGFARNDHGYMGRLTYTQNLSSVTAACMMIPRHVYNEVGGLDESFTIAFNDVDLCMRIRKAGYLIVFTPYAELYHFESKSRGLEDTLEKQKRFNGEVLQFHKKWGKELAKGDPYYNPNLSLTIEDFSTR